MERDTRYLTAAQRTRRACPRAFGLHQSLWRKGDFEAGGMKPDALRGTGGATLRGLAKSYNVGVATISRLTP